MKITNTVCLRRETSYNTEGRISSDTVVVANENKKPIYDMCVRGARKFGLIPPRGEQYYGDRKYHEYGGGYTVYGPWVEATISVAIS